MKLILYIPLIILLLPYSCQKEAIPQEEQIEQQASINELINNGTVTIGQLPSMTVLNKVMCTGRIDIPPTDITSIHSKISGQIKNLKYLPGDYVKKGRLVGTVENPSLVQNQRTLLETQVEMDMALKDFTRKEALLSTKATTDKMYEEAKSRYDLLKATFNGLKQELGLYGINTEELLTQQKFQSEINVYAASSGRVQEVLVNNGQMITPEQAIIKMANENHKHLELKVLSKDIVKIKMGQEVSFFLPSDGKEHRAKIVKINPMLTEGSSTLQIHCHIEESTKESYVAGLFVNAQIRTDSIAVRGLPIEAVIKEGDEYFGYQVNGEGTNKTALLGATAYKDFVTFQNINDSKWITKGAYYVE